MLRKSDNPFYSLFQAAGLWPNLQGLVKIEFKWRKTSNVNNASKYHLANFSNRMFFFLLEILVKQFKRRFLANIVLMQESLKIKQLTSFVFLSCKNHSHNLFVSALTWEPEHVVLGLKKSENLLSCQRWIWTLRQKQGWKKCCFSIQVQKQVKTETSFSHLLSRTDKQAKDINTK